ncbi:MAG TPA: DUF4157 domain-containing protein [Kofleriaceae bacterium]|nr:DUF4157 domain-containing protein [Kofleriaceae bacterium]
MPRLQLKNIDDGKATAAEHGDVHRIASTGVAGPGSALPHLDAIQHSFGPDHDVSRIEAHVGGAAGDAAAQLGARAYATGNSVAFDAAPDLHTAAHEATHVVQQRSGVQLKGGVGAAGDAYEAHADAVAERVVRGESAAELLAPYRGGGTSTAAVQRAPAARGASAAIAAPAGGINKSGFVDNSDGANLRTGPAEAGGHKVIDDPLPPATRVFVSGTYPGASQWVYVTAFLPDQIVRGYVQYFRVTMDLPEPLAKLHEVKSGDTAEKLAVQEYKSSVRDGHDLRYYENVLLFVNKERGRAGITGTYQDPGLLGGGANNIQLIAGHRIWLVSPAYAHALEGVVPDGSLTNGVYAKVKRFVQHVVDIIKSVTQSPSYFGEVAGEYAQAIRDHLPEIIGIIAGFIAAEAASAFLAATPTGVSQIAAVLIQLALAAFGAAGMAEAGIEAAKHASQWLTLAWSAKGKDEQIAAASREFLRMLVSVAMAALAYTGIKGNLGKAVQIEKALPPIGMVPAVAGGGGRVGPAVSAGTGVKLGVPGPAGPLGTAGGMKMENNNKEGGGGGEKPKRPTEDAILDDSIAKHAKPAEQATAGRVAKQSQFKGRKFAAPPPPDPGFDWIDDLGRTFDAMGDGTKAKYFKFDQFKESIVHHLRKGNTYTVIDMTGYTAEQIAQVRAFVDTLPADKIIRVGF